ncbi:TPA: hypothetical protein ACX6S8_002614 [Photobacterium damselae]|uniref:hypothetical protein n=1 Tax=Photobacterium damselae TaxID=38293 RepID=UPI001EFD4946|nr:hypothetical protein [Photobacterium damselae]MCG9778742.1 hypothetical protein [Photobacterium damselae]
MSVNDNNMLSHIRLSDVPHQNAQVVIEWLRHQPDYVGEAIAKMCYQLISNHH